MSFSYRMRGYDGTLSRYVQWSSTIVDAGAGDYTGPGPVTDVVVLGKEGGGGSSGIVVKDEGSSLGTFTALDIVGGGVMATDAGGGVAQITVPTPPTPTIVIEDEATPLGSFTAINFAGDGVSVVNAGGGLAQVSIATAIQDEGVPAGDVGTINFAGTGVAAVVVGGVATVTIPGAPADSDAVIFDDSVPGTDVNIRSNRAANQSPIDNTKAGITDFGSKTSAVDPSATGATGNYSTNAGGEDNSASGDHTFTVGRGAVAAGLGTIAIGRGDAVDAASTDSVSMAGSTVEGATTAFAAAGGYANKSNAVAIGSSNAQGSQSVAAGGSTVTEGSTGAAAIAGGSQADGNFSTGIANGQATGAQATAIGGSTATGRSATAIGEGYASGRSASALGESEATGDYSAALGHGSATAANAMGFGHQSGAKRKGQFSYAAGKFSSDADPSPGLAQTSFMVMRGETVTGVGSETTDLVTGDAADQEFTLEANHHYLVTVYAVAAGNISGGSSVTDSTETFFQTYSVKFEGVTPTVIAGFSDKIDDVVNANGNPSAWTLTASIQSSPDRLRLRFATNGAPAVTRIVAKVEFVEVLFV